MSFEIFREKLERCNIKQRGVYDNILKGGISIGNAVPGSGKTATIEVAVCGLIYEKGVDPNRIFISTFTRKAATEMKERIESSLGSKANELNIYTFHAFCFHMLRKYSGAFKRNTKFDMIKEENQTRIFNKVVKTSLDYLEEVDRITREEAIEYSGMTDAFFGKIERLKTGNTTVKDYAEQAEIIPGAKFEENNVFLYIWLKYEQYKKEHNLLDFNDILIEVNDLLDDEDFRRCLQKFCEYIIIDEFQDTNNLQMSIIVKLKGANLAVLGDKNQSIYKFRGANVELFNNFADIFNGTEVSMNINYRSHSIINNAATELIRNNPNESDDIISMSPVPEDSICQIKTFNSHEDEAEFIANYIAENKMKLGSIGIIYRNNIIGEEIGRKLKEKSIFYDRKEEYDIFMKIEIKTLFSFIAAYTGDDSVMSKLFLQARGIGKKSIERVEIDAEANGETFLSTALKSDNKMVLAFAEKIQAFVTNKELNDILKMYDYLLNEMGLIDLEPKRLKNIEYMFSILNEFEQVDKIRIDELIKIKEKTCRLLTCHASKGLEFDTVFLPAFAQGIIPSKAAIFSDDIEEERRLAYVAITRAKKNLIFSYSHVRHDHAKTNNYEISQFLHEFDTTKFGIDNTLFLENKKQEARVANSYKEVFNKLIS